MELLLIRHGETPWNREQRFQGVSDVELSEQGREQALRLRDHIHPVEFDLVISSDLKRALDTAALVSGLPRERIELDSGLREMNQGELEGLTWTEGMTRYRELMARWMTDPVDLRIPGGETIREVAGRVASALHRVRERGHRRRVLVVSHNLAISAGLAGLLGRPIEEFRKYRQEPCAINRIRWDDDHPELVCCNDFSFLPSEHHTVRYGPHADADER